MKIRPYEKKDFRYVQDICMLTSKYSEEINPSNRAFLCAMYCDYYLDNQADYCFVAVDDNDVPVGYVLCAVDVDDYSEQMQEMYLPLVRKISSGDYFHFVAESKIAERYVRHGYTAHLHVNILEEYQSEELGAKLLAALEKKLTEMFVEGVYLICAKKNEEARAFYEKNGYEDIDYLSNAIVYGKKFFKED